MMTAETLSPPSRMTEPLINENPKEKALTHWEKICSVNYAQPTIKDFSISAASYLFAFVGSIVVVPLGEKFGETVGDLTLADRETTRFLSYFFQISAYLSLASLGGVTANQKFRKLIAMKNGEETSRPAKIDYIFNSLSISFGIISAIQFAYVTDKYMGNTAGSVGSGFLSIIAFAMYALFIQDAIDITLNKGFLYYRDQKNPQDKAKRKFILGKLDQIKDLYFNAAPSVITLKHATASADNHSDEAPKLESLIKIAEESQGLQPEENPYRKHKPAVRFSGFLLGGLSGYAFYATTIEAMQWYYTGENYAANAAYVGFSQFIAVLACIANGALGAVGLEKRSDQLYSLATDKSFHLFLYSTNQELRKAITFLAVISGGSASAPITYLAYDYMQKSNHGWPALSWILLFVFLGPTAVRSESFEKMMNDLVDFLRGFLTPTDADKRDQLILAVDRISKEVPKLNTPDLDLLYSLFGKSSNSDIKRSEGEELDCNEDSRTSELV